MRGAIVTLASVVLAPSVLTAAPPVPGGVLRELDEFARSQQAGKIEPTEAAIHTALDRALPLLKTGAEGHMARRTCFACHNQALPMLAFSVVRERGLAIDEEHVRAQRQFIAAFLDKNRDNYRQGKGQGGQADTAGYALATLELAGHAPDQTTEAVVEYLLQRDKDKDHWRNTSNRPPSEASPFTTTYLALRGLTAWGTEAHKERIAQRIEAARRWLLTARPKDTEDRVFRLLALRVAGADDRTIQQAVVELLQTQRSDGGWAQTETMTSDAYATGSALVALHLAGGIRSRSPEYLRGAAFLLQSQRSDGSWLVRSRSRPFQTYYESGFPHGKDQFISIAATGWAATALALTLPPQLHGR